MAGSWWHGPSRIRAVWGFSRARYNADGTAVGSQLAVNSYKTGNQASPTVAMEADGDFLIVWQDEGGHDSSGCGVYAQQYHDTGSRWGGEYRVNTFTAGDQRSADVAVDSAGNYVVTWESQNQIGAGWEIYHRRGVLGSSTMTTETLVNVGTPGDQRAPAVAMDATGGYVLVWQSATTDGLDSEILVRRYAAAGTA